MTSLTYWSRRTGTLLTNSVQLFFKLGHNGFALMGLTLAFCVTALATQPAFRQDLEFRVSTFLQERQFNLLGMEVRPDAVERATALDPRDLPKPQAAVTYWLSERYRVAPEPLAALVAEAFQIGQRTRVEPTLLLAIMAIESGFNPFAQSPMGAQGLMQVMTKVHTDKYENFGGNHAAFDPVTNLRVGAKVLRDCVQRAGSLEGGLKQYVGAALSGNDGGYVIKVMAEFNRLQQVAAGKSVPVFAAPQMAVVSIPLSAASMLENGLEEAKSEAPEGSAKPSAKPTVVRPQVSPLLAPRKAAAGRDEKVASAKIE